MLPVLQEASYVAWRLYFVEAVGHQTDSQMFHVEGELKV